MHSGSFGPSHPWLGTLGYSLGRLNEPVCAAAKFYGPQSRVARESQAALRAKLERNETVYLLGIGPGGHNSGIALVEATRDSGLRLLANNEEERFSGVKHVTVYPEQAVDALLGQIRELGIAPGQIHGCLASWNYVRMPAILLQMLFEELPGSLPNLRQTSTQKALQFQDVLRAPYTAPRRLGRQMGLKRAFPIVGLRHHDNHAWFSYGVSPFASASDPVMVAVLDGMGDDGAISLYVARHGRLQLLYSNKSLMDSLGVFYSVISSTQGGWSMLSSEGRYMGAAAWGQSDRLTNPYYQRLRQIFYFHGNGEVYVNRNLANWPRALIRRPYTAALEEMIGPPIPPEKLWNPDAVLRPDDMQHAEITQERVDKAAATQLVFEDVLFHVVEHLIRTTRSSKLVLTGGIALNATANMRLLEHYDEAFYERYLGRKNTRLHLWVPPTPGDAGVTMGAAYHFAMAQGVAPGEPLQHAFFCGAPPKALEIEAALGAGTDLGKIPLGDVAAPGRREVVADLLAYLISQDGVVGLFQGAAETGPRALGHRSILANPCNAHTRDVLNQRVKFREAVRPLAPMATYEAAQRWFELASGASDDEYNAYNYMVLTVMARPESRAVIPAVIHRDGTSRLQIVRPETDPFTHAYLKAMGRRVGVEVSVNTSLNVASPIVQTPVQAIETLKRSKGMDALLFIGAEGTAFLCWCRVETPTRDPGRLRRWLAAWQEERGIRLEAGCMTFV